MESMDPWHKPGRGKYVVDASGKVVPALPLPDGVTASPDGALVVPAPTDLVKVPAVHIMGPTRIAEWMLVDIRAAKLVDKDSELFQICQRLDGSGGLGLVESTIVIDLLAKDLSEADRAVILDLRNWPTPR
jgi:hypothetical protein